jgi:hypothetical protein
MEMLLIPLSQFSQINKIDNDRVQEPHQDVQDRENDESFDSIGH